MEFIFIKVYTNLEILVNHKVRMAIQVKENMFMQLILLFKYKTIISYTKESSLDLVI